MGTLHRLLLIGFYVSLLYYDWAKFDPTEFGAAAVREGGTLTASSSWLPLYSVENALIPEQFITGEGTYFTPEIQSSWCANFNTVGEWIQVSLPKTEFWQGFKIAGNPLLGAYVTEISA